MKKCFTVAILSPLALFLFLASPVYADVDNPDSVSLYDMAVYRHLIEEDDFLAVIPYSITYGTEPDISIDKTFIFRFIDTDGTTELGACLAFPYINNGYGDGIVSFYFDADSAPTWETEYTVRVDGNPTQFSSPDTWPFTLPTSAYSSYDTQEENQALLKSDIIAIARDLEISWGIELLGESDVSTVLGDYGEAYFRNAIYGIQNMCPSLFSVEIVPLEPSDRTWDTDFADSFLTKYDGTWFGDALTGFGGLFNVETSAATSLASLVITIIMIGVLIWKLNATANSGLMHGTAALGLFTLLGTFSFTIHGLIAFMFALATTLVLFFTK